MPPPQDTPIGIKALILSKFYYGVLSKTLENISIDRYYTILFFLSDNNGCSQQYICNNLAIDKTAMVKVIEYLMRAGLIVKKVNPGDRREHFISLTKKGMKETENIVLAFRNIDKEIFSAISKQEKETFLKILDQLIVSVRALPGNDLFFQYKRTSKEKSNSEKRKSQINNG